MNNPHVIFHCISNSGSIDPDKFYSDINEKFEFFRPLGSDVSVSLTVAESFHTQQADIYSGIYHVNVVFTDEELNALISQGGVSVGVPFIQSFKGAYALHHSDICEVMLKQVTIPVEDRISTDSGGDEFEQELPVKRKKVLIFDPSAGYDYCEDDPVFVGSIDISCFKLDDHDKRNALDKLMDKADKLHGPFEKIILSGDNSDAYFRIMTRFKGVPIINCNRTVRHPAIFISAASLGITNLTANTKIGDIKYYLEVEERAILAKIVDGGKKYINIPVNNVGLDIGGHYSARTTELIYLNNQKAVII